MKPDLGNLQICMAQRENMEAIFHSVTDGILTVDPDLSVTNVNRPALAMLGVEGRDLIDRTVRNALRCRLWKIGTILEETMAGGGGARERENILVREDGGELRVLLSTNRLVDSNDQTAGAVVIFRDITHLRELEVRLERRASLHDLIGRSYAMQEIYSLVEQVAPTDSTVLILGESGTGKELVADAIHRNSRRQNGPFVKVNCSALSESLLEGELFGHVKGAFTGAIHDRKGRFERADKGTIFLDEIGDLTERIQVKLLRVIQEREVERVGDTRTIRIDTRILAATHQDLPALVKEGRFRHDLYYRLNVIPLFMPALRDRSEDIPILASHFLAVLGEEIGKQVEGISADALRAIMDHRWPGNVRELKNAIEHAVVKSRGTTLLLEDLPRDIARETAHLSDRTAERKKGRGRRDTTPDDERDSILGALEKTGWHRGDAADLLGVDRTTLWRKMRRLGLNRKKS